MPKIENSELYVNCRVNLSKKTISVPSLTKRIKKDPDLWRAYKANIAVQFQDKVYWYKKEHKKKYLDSEDIHRISNDAAEAFLKLWTR